MLSVPLHSPLPSLARSSSFSNPLLYQKNRVFGPHCNQFLRMQKRKVLKGILQGVRGVKNSYTKKLNTEKIWNKDGISNFF